MTYSPVVLFILCLAACNVQGKVELKKGRIERVKFDGDDLAIAVDNTGGKGGRLDICFGSTPDVSDQPCPSGFTVATVSMRANSKLRLAVNRQGLFLDTALSTVGDIKFNNDGTLNITVVGLPDARTVVVLENANIFEAEKLEEEEKVKKKSNGATIGITIGVIGLVLLIIGIIAAVVICLYRRKKSQNQLIMPPEIVVQSAPEVTKTPVQTPETNPKKEMPSTLKAAPEPMPKSPQTPIKTPPTPKAIPAEPKPTTPAATVSPTPPADAAGLQPTSPSTEPVEQQQNKAVKKVKSKGKAKANPLAESTEQTKEASIDQQEKKGSKRDSKKSLRVEKTQSATVPSPPSLKFSEHPYSKAVAKTSVLKEKDNLKYEETANPFTKKIDYSKVDRLTRLQLLTESIRCYGMRNGNNVTIGSVVWYCIIPKRQQKQTPEVLGDLPQSPQCSPRANSIHQTASTKKVVKQASTTTTLQTTVSPKPVAYPSSGKLGVSIDDEADEHITT
uniref:Uncharacterized protein n=1 Tax=Panagrellus redivivus TaxID=6233 RepID=A0A7E4ZTW8_PANRE